MKEGIFEVMTGCLLHDVGKVVYRAGVGEGSHSSRGADYLKRFLPDEMLHPIRYHHGRDLKNAAIPANDAAYIAYIADNISAGTDRRAETKGESETRFDRYLPLESIFCHINPDPEKAPAMRKFNAGKIGDCIQYPALDAENTAFDYKKVLDALTDGLKGLKIEAGYANSLIELLQRCLAYVPSSTAIGERADVSLYHHCKTTAAIGCCIKEYLDYLGVSDYRTHLMLNEDTFMSEKAFVLYGLDLSGIQKFIYTISSAGKGALKSLRARSFYLSMLMEHIADQIIEACGLFRTNLIYVGGGKAYLLLPNVPELLAQADSRVNDANRFLRHTFGAALFLASGKAVSSGAELTSNGGTDESFPELFRTVSAQMSEKKLHRYNAAELRELNAHASACHDRECSVCGSSGTLRKQDDDTFICSTCERFEAFAAAFKATVQAEQVLIVGRMEKRDSLPLPLNLWLSAMDVGKARELLKSSEETICRIYSVNRGYTGLKLAARVSVGNYSAIDAQGERLSFEQLSDASLGIKRLGVLRADVDNLGAVFARGFVDHSARNPWRFATLSRYTALSMAMTEFFQHDINRIIRGKENRSVSVVYAGGDDVFLVGAWNEVLDAGLELRREFARYTGDSVTLSAGFSFFKNKTPVAVMANDTARLEADAKQIGDGGKNAISLFEPKQNNYHWETLEKDILGTMLPAITSAFSGQTESDNGNAFLYRVIELLRDIRPHTMGIARLAYALGRHKPTSSASQEAKEAYESFEKQAYRRAMSPEENRRLQTAILYYVYLNREEKTTDGKATI